MTYVLHFPGECRQTSLPRASILEPLNYPRLLKPVFKVTSGHTTWEAPVGVGGRWLRKGGCSRQEALAATTWDWRLSVLSLAAMALLRGLSGMECARQITEHGPGQNLVCHPVSVSGTNKAFLGAAISVYAGLRYRCSVSYLWQLLIVQAFLHLWFPILGK